MHEVPAPCTRFDWNVYSNATLAGLAPLIPFPLVDWAFEEYFRRRMVRAIARHRGLQLARGVATALNRQQGCITTCLTLPFTLVLELIKRTFKKLLYFLSIKSATDRVSHYWHRAFLIDCMVLQGHLGDVESARAARQAMTRALDETSTSPMLSLARIVVSNTGHAFRALRRAIRGSTDEEIEEKRSMIKQHWGDFRDHLHDVAARYNAYYHLSEIREPPGTES